MTRLTLLSLALALLLPAGAYAQDSTRVRLDTTLADRNCTDFQTRLQAQGYFLMLQLVTGEEDPDRLDADGNGQACESIQRIRVRQFDPEHWIVYREREHRVKCATIGESFTLPEFKAQAQRATRDSVRYSGPRGFMTRMECLDTIGELQAR